MDAEFVSQTLFWIIVTIISVSMSIIGYLITRMVSKNDKEIEALKQGSKEMDIKVSVHRDAMDTEHKAIMRDFQVGVNGIKEAVSEIKNFISIVKAEHSTQIKDLTRRVDRKEKWLECHDSTLDNHSARLTAVETKCKMKHE